MFENEVEQIFLKRKNSLELIEKLESIYKPFEYGGEKYNDFFGIDYRVCGTYTIETKAMEAMKNILQYRELRNKTSNKTTLEELAEVIKATTIDDFYLSMVYYFPYNKDKEYEFFTAKTGDKITKMQYTETKIYWRKLQLILNCIWLLNHEEPTTHEVNNKLYKMAENGETFIFAGCKVTNYKNGNLKIQFSDAKIFEEFKTRFNKALEQAKKDYEREQNARN